MDLNASDREVLSNACNVLRSLDTTSVMMDEFKSVMIMKLEMILSGQFDIGGSYKTPTDIDAKTRPVVEVRNSESDPWIAMRLVYVSNGTKSHNFKVTNEKGFNVFSYRFCRMKVEG